MILEAVLKAKTGDSTAMLEVIERFSRLLKKYARKLGYEDAYSDLLVELITIIKACPADKFPTDCEGAVVNYLSKALYHAYIALSKRHQAIQYNETCWSDLSDEQQYVTECIGAVTMEGNLAVELLDDLSLTGHQRKILFLLFYEGLPVSEIARRQGVSRQSINQAKKNALKALRQSLAKMDGGRGA